MKFKVNRRIHVADSTDNIPIDYHLVHSKENRPLRVLFLSADTGGGHRASAESLAKQVR